MTSPNEPRAHAPYLRVALRVAPLLYAAYVAAYLNRMNVGFAKLSMVADLGFSDTVYGLGSGVFFIGYLLLEVPSNLMLHRIGARVWIARIMVTWGVLSAATMFARTPMQFYVLRFLLGAAEAGFFPGMILYLTYWFPRHLRARIMAWLISAISASGALGGPVSGWILHNLDGFHGLAGWKWLFVIEGLPAILVGFAILAWLPSSIREARWLSEGEKGALAQAIAAEQDTSTHLPLLRMFTHARVWGLCLIYFLIMVGLAGLSFWMPQILRNAGVRTVMGIGLLSSVPYGLAAVMAILVGLSSDRTGERFWHCILCLSAAAVGFALVALFGSNIPLALLGLTLASGGVIASLPLFWTYPPAFLGGVAAAAGIALINSVGNLGGFACPYLVGALNDATHRQEPGIYLITASLTLAVVLSVGLLRHRKA